jgi:hypothetical protein
MKKRPSGFRAAAMAVAAVAIAAIAIPLLSSSVGATVWVPPASPSTTAPFNECPAIGDSTQGCAVLIILSSSGPATIVDNPNTTCGPSGHLACDGPFDGQDDTLVGIVNQTNVAIPTVALSSSTDIFGFDGDGICSSSHGAPTYGDWTGQTGCPYDTTGYGGPGTSFSGYSSATKFKVGNVNFSGGGLAAGSSTFFSLESSLNSANFTIPASFVVTKSATPGSVIAGSSTPITYTLTAQNLGGTAGDLTISDGIPTGTTYVAGSVFCPAVTTPETCTAGETGGNVSYDITNVPAGASIAVTFQVTANASTTSSTVSNTAIWSGPGCITPTGDGNTGNTGGDDDGTPLVAPAAIAIVTCDTNTTTTTVTAPIPVTITADATSTVYGTVPTVGFTIAGDTDGPPATGPTCVSGVVATTPVGTYTNSTTPLGNSCSGASDPRYTISYDPANAVVTPAVLTATAANGTFIYGGGATPALRARFVLPTISVASITGFVNSETSAIITTQPTCTTTATGSSPVGNYPTTCSGGVAPNYSFNYVAGVMAVTPAALTVTASSAQANIGAAIPAVTASYTGFVNSDTVSSLTTAPTCSTTATTSSPAGVYPTSCTGAVDPNYVISYVPGTLGLTAAPVTAPAAATPAAPAAAAAAPAAAPATAASTSPAIAFTGAMLDQEWIFGVSALLVGFALLLIGRRMRQPKHAAGR